MGGLAGLKLTRARAALAVVVLVGLVRCDGPPTSPAETDPRVLWLVPGSGWNVTPSMDGDAVYFGGVNHDVIAVEKATGHVRWRAATMVSPDWTWGSNTLVVNDVVVIGDIDVYAFDRRTGVPRWMFQPADLDVPGRDVLATDGETIFAASTSNRVYAIDPATGTQRWVTQLPEPDSSASFNPTVHDGLVAVGIKRFGIPTRGALAMLEAHTGRILWVREFDGSYPNAVYGCLGGAVFYGDLVIASVEDGRVYGLDRRTGDVRWTAPRVHALPPEPGGGYGDKRPLAITGNVVMVGSTRGVIVGLDAATGAERWRLEASAADVGFAGTDYTSEEATFYVTKNGLYVIDAATGAIRWQTGQADAHRQTPRFVSPALPDADKLFLSGAEGFFALRK